MAVYKFQLDATGTEVLIYNEERTDFLVASNPDYVKIIRKAVRLKRPMQKAYAEAQVGQDGRIEIGKTVGGQIW